MMRNEKGNAMMKRELDYGEGSSVIRREFDYGKGGLIQQNV